MNRARAAKEQKDQADSSIVRICATLEPQVYQSAKAISEKIGFKYSFSAYVNELLKRDVEQRKQLLCAQA